jgi:hypothetical protein
MRIFRYYGEPEPGDEVTIVTVYRRHAGKCETKAGGGTCERRLARLRYHPFYEVHPQFALADTGILEMTRVWCALAIALLLTAIRISAHHAFAAEYDENKLVTVSGTVTEFEWINPHAWLYVDGKDANGTPGNWSFEMGAPGGLVRRGWKKSDLKKAIKSPWTAMPRRIAAM